MITSLSIALAFVLILLGLYKYQIRLLVRELARIRSNEPTNQLLNQEVASKEVTLLVSGINHVLQDDRNHAKQFQMKERTVQESLTHLAHDLRTPLAALEGYLQLLETSQDETARLRYQAIMQERIKHTRHLMDQYFTSLKYDTDTLSLPMTPIDPDELLLQTLLTYQHEFEKRSIEPSIDLNTNAQILAHPESFIRLCQNLIHNALVHGVDYLRVSSSLHDGQYQLILENGRTEVSLDESRLFDRFYKGNTARTTDSTGLGLSIVKGLVQHLHGTISLNVQPKSFQVTLQFPEKKN